MSGTLPTTPGFSTTRIESNQPINVVIGDSGKRQARILGGHLWKAKCTYDLMKKEMMKPLFAFLAKQRGSSFLVAIQPHDNAVGTISGVVSTVGASSKGDGSIDIDGAGATDTFLAGDFFTLATHSKAYMVTDDAVAVAGAMTINIEPPLIEDVADNTVLTHTDVKFTMALVGDISEYKAQAPSLSTHSIDLVEAIT